MAYVGTPIDTTNTFQSLTGDRFDGDGSAVAFTLSTAPASTLDIEVFVGNVRQDPNSAYTVSGTTLTFTGAPPSGTNNIYVVHQAKSVGTIDVPDDIISGKTLVTLDNSADHVLIEDATDGELKKALIPSASTVADTFTINGSTPTLTIGDAGAEDTKIVFDGNAQDFHIGLDDSADDLVIGLGSTLGTTSHIVIDEAGHITTPLQSGFVTTNSSSNSNVTGDETNYTMVFDSDIVDRNADHAHASGTFTAPVTGLYNFSCALSLGGIASNHTRLILSVETSNRIYYMKLLNINNSLHNSGSLAVGGAITADMDASDTAVFKLRIDGGSKVVDVDDASLASGFLIG